MQHLSKHEAARRSSLPQAGRDVSFSQTEALEADALLHEGALFKLWANEVR